MSDRSSESSCEWVLLDDNNEVEGETCALNLDVNFDSVCGAASASINPSLSSEDFEWEYDKIETDSDSSPHDFSCVEDLDLDEFHVEYNGNSNIDEIEDMDMGCDCSKGIKEDVINVASIQKAHCYKHDRNDNLNFVLNIMVALVVSSAIGLGIGHFLGWSHKCWKSMPELKDSTPNYNTAVKAITKENTESFLSNGKETIVCPSYVESQSEIVDLSSKMHSMTIYKTTCKENSINNIITDLTTTIDSITEISSLNNTHVLNVSVTNEVSQSNFSDSEYSIVKNVFPDIDWNKISRITVPVKSINEHSSAPNKNTVILKSASEYLSLPMNIASSHLSDLDEKLESDVGKDSIFNRRQYYKQSDSFKHFNAENLNKGSNFTSQLHEDLIQVVQILNAVVLSQLSNHDEKYISVEDLGIVVKLYKELQNTLDTKIYLIKNFVKSEDYQRYSKFGLKYLQKMVYSLIDCFDSVMKMSLNTFDKNRKINVYKFSKNISKLIFNFDKKWCKNEKIWSENLERAELQELKRKSFQNSKTKFYQKEKNHRKGKYSYEKGINKRNSIKF